MDKESIEDTPEQIEKATLQGWNPDFEGEGKKSAKQFIEDGEKINAVLKDRIDKISDENIQTKEELGKTRKAMEKMSDFFDGQKKQAVEKAISKLNADRDTAIEEGNKEDVHKIDKEIEKHVEAIKEPPKNEAFDAWIGDNAWYSSDPFLKVEADKVGEHYSNSGFSGKKLYEAVTAHIKELFPDKFENPNRKEQGLEGSTHRKEGKKKGWSMLNKEQQDAFHEFKDLMPNNPNMTKEKWAAKFEDE